MSPQTIVNPNDDQSPKRLDGETVDPSENPFRVRCIQPGSIPFWFADIDGSVKAESAQADRMAKLVGDCIAILNQQCGKALLVGPHGSGKTTLLLALRRALQTKFAVRNILLTTEESSHENFARIQQLIRGETRSADLLIIDGLEQLSRWHRWRLDRLLRRADLACLATSHHHLPNWVTVFETNVNEALLSHLLVSLLDQQPDHVRQAVINHLQQRPVTNALNVRDLWFELYDVVGDCAAREPAELPPPD